MTDHPIAPDLSGDVPRCQASCPHFDTERRERGPDWYDEDGICRHESALREPGDICLPYTRHLKVLSERRCDGCEMWSSETGGSGWCRTMLSCTGAPEFCSRWEPKQQ